MTFLFNLTNPPTFVATTTLTTYTPPSSLSYNTVYFWQVAAHVNSQSVPGPVWNFTTKSVVTQAGGGNPVSGSLNVPLNTALSWASGTADAGYVLYFSAGNPPSFMANVNKTVYRTFYYPALSPNTTYYWQVNTLDISGNTITGAIWNFSTVPPARAGFPAWAATSRRRITPPAYPLSPRFSGPLRTATPSPTMFIWATQPRA